MTHTQSQSQYVSMPASIHTAHNLSPPLGEIPARLADLFIFKGAQGSGSGMGFLSYSSGLVPIACVLLSAEVVLARLRPLFQPLT